MRVLVTGHGGYIGAVLTRQLTEHGHEVVGVDTGFMDDCDFGAPPTPIPTLRKDIRDLEKSDFKGFEGVVHLAALSNDPMGQLDPRLTIEINAHHSARIARAARQAGVARFVFSSSCSVYGLASTIVTEQASVLPQTSYAESKVMAEAAIRPMSEPGFCPVILRNATVYGCSPRMRFDLVVNNLVGWAHTAGDIHLRTDGSAWRPLIHVQDLARAFEAALLKPEAEVSGQVFNVGFNDQNVTVKEIAEIVRGIVPGSKVTYAGGGADFRSYKVNFEKAARILGLGTARWSILSGAQEIYEQIRQLGFGPEDFDSRKYTRLTQLKYLLASEQVGPDMRRVTTPSRNG
jgi:nucleoside-diphosphate-sugar epimerase